jgi:S1-C subfamily serine protease
MRIQHKLNPAWLALIVLVLASMACSIGQDNVNVSDQPSIATPANQSQQSTPQQSSGGNGLSTQQRAALISSEVRLLAMFPDGNDYSPKWLGSGTIISPDGYILTNVHVAKPSAFGDGEEDPSYMVVGMVEQEDKAPVYSYVAEVVAADGYLDLALLHIIGTTDGNKVNAADLNLPYVDLGSSDDMHVGDHISIFGFPGIGGETITYTSGNFAGWTNEDQVGDRAWMKLDATIAGGNSGGMVADDSGHIVGVPTQGGSGSGGNITDCRVIQDTNGDGVVDDKDTCIPFGGFINAARPINLAKPLILAAENQKDYASPYNIAGSGAISGGTEPGSGNEKFGDVTWVTLDSQGSPQEQVDSYPSGTEVIAGSFDYSGMTDGETWGMIWYLEGKEVGRGTFQWSDGPEGTMTVNFSNNDNSSLADGNYSVELYAGTGDQVPMLSKGEVTVGGGENNGGLAPRPSKSDGIQVSGTIVDNDTQRGIKGALFVVLNPGVTLKQWQSKNYPDSMVFTSAQSDSRGEFSLPDLLQRETAYDIVVAADGYTAQVFKQVSFTSSDKADQNFSIPLTKQ